MRYVSEFIYFSQAKVTFKVIQGHWQWCHSIGHIRFPISLFRCNYVSILHAFQDIITHFPKFKEVT